MRPLCLFFACGLLAACGSIPSPLGKPAYRITSTNSQNVTIEYDEQRVSQDEVNKIGKSACSAYAKEAFLASNQISLAGQAGTRINSYRCKSAWDINNEKEWERIRAMPDPDPKAKPR